jgi:glucosamine-phosphate N-acetyltransferase
MICEFDYLKETDFDEYLDLLKNLTIVSKELINISDFKKRMEILNDTVIIVRHENKIIGSGSLYIMPKFIHNLGYLGQLEDIIIDPRYQGKGIGKKLLDYLIKKSREKKCYKIILNCSEKNIGFYQKLGFDKKETQMVMYLNYS